LIHYVRLVSVTDRQTDGQMDILTANAALNYTAQPTKTRHYFYILKYTNTSTLAGTISMVAG